VLGVIGAFLLSVLCFAAIGFLFGALLPGPRAAQGLGVLLWFVMFMISGSGPPPEVLPDALDAVATATPLKHVIVLIQDPWLGFGWNAGELIVVVGMLVVAALRTLAALGLTRRLARCSARGRDHPVRSTDSDLRGTGHLRDEYRPARRLRQQVRVRPQRQRQHCRENGDTTVSKPIHVSRESETKAPSSVRHAIVPWTLARPATTTDESLFCRRP
jgi:ABC-2 type transporter